METFFGNKNLFKFIWKWRLVFTIIIIFTIIISIIFSGPTFIKPKFKSFAIVYPSNLQEYSKESTTEQMLQILQSKQLRLKLIDAFHLYSHYNISQKYKYAQTAIFNELNDDISISKTSYESVKIEVLDYYPDTAKMMVDSIISFYNQIVRKVQNIKYKEVVDIDRAQISKLQKKIDSIKTILTNYREKYNIYNPKLQSEQITKQYLQSDKPKTNNLYHNMIKYSGDIMLEDSLLQSNLSELVTYNDDLCEAMGNYQKKITYANIISAPIPADKKSYPIRWIIVVLSVIGSFLFAFIALVFYESFQEKQ